MDKNVYEQLKSKIQAEHDSAQDRAEKQYVDDMAALDRIWALAGSDDLGSSSPIKREQRVINLDSHPEKRTARNVRAAIEILVDEIYSVNHVFDWRDIMAGIEKFFDGVPSNKHTVGQKMRLMEKDGFLTLVQQGSGSSSNMYKRNLAK